jgi:hypothetical protein
VSEDPDRKNRDVERTYHEDPPTAKELPSKTPSEVLAAKVQDEDPTHREAPTVAAYREIKRRLEREAARRAAEEPPARHAPPPTSVREVAPPEPTPRDAPDLLVEIPPRKRSPLLVYALVFGIFVIVAVVVLLR